MEGGRGGGRDQKIVSKMKRTSKSKFRIRAEYSEVEEREGIMRIKYLRGFRVFELGYPELPGKGVALVLDPKGSFLSIPAPGDRKEDWSSDAVEIEVSRREGKRTGGKRKTRGLGEREDGGGISPTVHALNRWYPHRV